MEFESMDERLLGVNSPPSPFLSGVDIGLWLRLVLALVAMVSAGIGVAVSLS